MGITDFFKNHTLKSIANKVTTRSVLAPTITQSLIYTLAYGAVLIMPVDVVIKYILTAAYLLWGLNFGRLNWFFAKHNPRLLCSEENQYDMRKLDLEYETQSGEKGLLIEGDGTTANNAVTSTESQARMVALGAPTVRPVGDQQK